MRSTAISYDFSPFHDEGKSGGWALRPIASVKVLPGSNLRSVMSWVGLEVVYWTGLDEQELVLPVDEAYRAGARKGRRCAWTGESSRCLSSISTI